MPFLYLFKNQNEDWGRSADFAYTGFMHGKFTSVPCTGSYEASNAGTTGRVVHHTKGQGGTSRISLQIINKITTNHSLFFIRNNNILQTWWVGKLFYKCLIYTVYGTKVFFLILSVRAVNVGEDTSTCGRKCMHVCLSLLLRAWYYDRKIFHNLTFC